MHIDLLIPFFNLFRDEDLPLWLSLAIVGIGALFFIIYLFSVYYPVHRSLHRAIKALKKIEGRVEFCKCYQDLDPVFQSSWLKHNWEGFKETFILPGKYEEEKVIRNTIRPFKYFNFENLSQQYNISFYQSLPNIIVGIGLLLTFCGLVSAIYLTGASIVSVHTDDVIAHSGSLKNALDSLLKIAAFKFLTSIAGLITSIILTLEIRICNGSLRNDYSTLNTVLERNLRYESQEHLICTQQNIALHQLDHLRRMNETMQGFTATYAQETAQKNALALNHVLKLYADKFNTAVENGISDMSRQVSEAASESMSRLVSEFSQALRAETGREMADLAQAFRNAEQAIDAVTHHFRQSGEAVSLALTQAGDSQKEAMSNLFETFISTSQQSLERLETSLEDATAQLDRKIVNASEKLDQSGGELARALSQSAANVRDSFEGLSQVLGNSVRESGESLRTSLADAAKTMEEKLLLASEQVSTSGQTLSSTLSLSSDTLTSTVHNLSDSFTKSAEQSCDLLHAVIADASQILEQSIQSASKEMKVVENTVCATLGLSADALQTQVEAMFETSRQSVDECQKIVSTTLNEAGEGLRTNLAQVMKEMQDLQTSLNSSCTRSLETFTSQAEEISRNFGAMGSKNCDQLVETTRRASEALEACITSAAGRLEDFETRLRTHLSESQDVVKAHLTGLLDGIEKSTRESVELLEKTATDAAAMLAKNAETSSQNMAELENSLMRTLALSQDAFKESMTTVTATGTKSAEQQADLMQHALTATSQTMKQDLLSASEHLQRTFGLLEAHLEQAENTASEVLKDSMARVAKVTEINLEKNQTLITKSFESMREHFEASVLTLTERCGQVLTRAAASLGQTRPREAVPLTREKGEDVR